MPLRGLGRARGLEQKWLTLIAVGSGTFMATMDFSIVNVALPTFSREFGRSPDTVVWVALAASLVVTGLTLTAGRAGDLYGRKRVYLLGWAIFTVGVTAASFAQSLEQLILLRVLQSVGVSMAIANSNALVTAAFPDEERGRSLGLISSVVGAGLMSGPIVGGLLLGVADWRAIFYARIPVGIIAIAMGVLAVREPAREPMANRRLDVAGALLLFVALSTLLTAVNRGQAWGWTSPPSLALGVLGVLAFALFLRVEGRTMSPIISLALFRVRSFATSVASLMLNFVGQSSVIFLMPFYLIEVRGFGTTQTGLILATLPLMLLIFSTASGLLHDRTGWRHQVLAGVALVTLGLFSMATLTAETPVLLVLARLALVGLGSVLFGPANSSVIMGSVPRSMLGTASASVATSRNLGNAVGLAVASAVFAVVAGSVAGQSVGELPSVDLLRGIRAAFFVAGCLSVLAILAAATQRTARGASVAARHDAVSLRRPR